MFNSIYVGHINEYSRNKYKRNYNSHNVEKLCKMNNVSQNMNNLVVLYLQVYSQGKL